MSEADTVTVEPEYITSDDPLALVEYLPIHEGEKARVEIELHLDTGTLRYSIRESDWISARERHGVILTWTVDALVPVAANRLLATIAPYAQTILDHAETYWGGSNVQGFVHPGNEEVHEIQGEVENALEQPGAVISVIGASDWYEPENTSEEIGLTPETDDDELDRMRERLETDSLQENTVVIGTQEWLEEQRESLQLEREREIEGDIRIAVKESAQAVNASTQQRNTAIKDALNHGLTLRTVAEDAGLSRQTVANIAKD